VDAGGVVSGVTPGAGDAFDPVALAEIRRLLGAVDDLWRRQAAAGRASPAPGSLAALDNAFPDARWVGIFANQALGTSIDHLNAWRLLVHGPMIPILAHLTPLRGSLEASVRCRWFVDASINSRTRVARGWAARRDDQVERGRFEASREGAGEARPATRGMSAADRIAALDSVREATLNSADDTAGVPSVGFTDTTALAITYGLERWFRLSSAGAHGKEWALAAAALTPTADTTPPPGVSHGIVSASEPVAHALTIEAVLAAQAALADLEAYIAAPPAAAPRAFGRAIRRGVPRRRR
jgi:hypothetical protein